MLQYQSVLGSHSNNQNCYALGEREKDKHPNLLHLRSKCIYVNFSFYKQMAASYSSKVTHNLELIPAFQLQLIFFLENELRLNWVSENSQLFVTRALHCTQKFAVWNYTPVDWDRLETGSLPSGRKLLPAKSSAAAPSGGDVARLPPSGPTCGGASHLSWNEACDKLRIEWVSLGDYRWGSSSGDAQR